MMAKKARSTAHRPRALSSRGSDMSWEIPIEQRQTNEYQHDYAAWSVVILNDLNLRRSTSKPESDLSSFSNHNLTNFFPSSDPHIGKHYHLATKSFIKCVGICLDFCSNIPGGICSDMRCGITIHMQANQCRSTNSWIRSLANGATCILKSKQAIF